MAGTAAFLFGSVAHGQSLLQVWEPAGGVLDFCPLADLDGDGAIDVALGRPIEPAVLGIVNIRSGATGALLGQVTGVGIGITDQGGFGETVAPLGDVTGDGIPEFLAGVSDVFSTTSTVVSGKVAVVSPVGPSLVRILTNGVPGDQFGIQVAGGLDANADGWPDAIISSFPSPVPGLVAPGQVNLFDVVSGSLLYSVTGSASQQLLGTIRVTGWDDLDGDGHDDWAATRNVVNLNLIEVPAFSGATGVELFSLNPPVGFGRGMATVADLDFDGIRELAGEAGNPANPFVGQVMMFSGTTPFWTFAPVGPTYLLDLGWSTDDAGDVDGDGYTDVVMGAPSSWQPSGTGFPGYGAVVVASPARNEVLGTMNGTVQFGGMGLVVHGVGDIDGDGLSDVAALAAGPVNAWSLRPTGIQIDGTACPGSTGTRPVIGASGTATVGGMVTIFLSRVPPVVPALLLFGPAANNWAGVPLPIDLAPLGLPGCMLAVPILGAVPVVTGFRPGPGIGGGEVGIAVPSDPSLVGGSAAFQWYAADPGPGAFPGVTTRRLVATVQ